MITYREIFNTYNKAIELYGEKGTEVNGNRRDE